MTKFKIGDKVKRCKENIDVHWNLYCKRDFTPSQECDSIFEIIDINENDDRKLKLKHNNDDFFYYKGSFDLVSSSDADFKIGDKVRFKDKKAATCWFDINHENLEIKESVDKDGDVILYNYDKSFSWYVKEEYLEYMPQESEIKYEFKNTKFYIKDIKESHDVQKRLFELGYEWYNSKKELRYYENAWFYINEQNKIKWNEHAPSNDYKKITIQDILSNDNFKNTKVRIFNKEQSKQVQEVMFKKRYSWGSGKQFNNCLSSFPGHLYFNCNRHLGFTNSDSEPFFLEHENKEILVRDILQEKYLGIDISTKVYDADGIIVPDKSLKGGKKQKMGDTRTIYKVVIVDKRNSAIIADINVAAQGSTTAVLKAMNGKYNVKDVDHYHYDVTSLTSFDAEKDDTAKKK